MRTPSLLLPEEDQPLYAEPPDDQLLLDLGLERVISGALDNWREYSLEEIYHRPLRSREAVRYRQHVFADLQSPGLNEAARSFLQGLQRARQTLLSAQKAFARRQQERWFLDALRYYLRAVDGFAESLAALSPRSKALQEAREYLESYRSSAWRERLQSELDALLGELAGVRYLLHVSDGRIGVFPYDELPDLSSQLQKTFAIFADGGERRRFSFADHSGLNHIEEQVLEGVAKLYPRVFARLRAFSEEYQNFWDDGLRELEKGVAFYLSYYDYTTPARKASVTFSFADPAEGAPSWAKGAVELGLTLKLLQQGAKAVANDFEFHEEAAALLVTGPNQAGKTTFARMVGQLHYLNALGLDVPAERARLSLPGHYLSHFPRREDAADLKSRLEKDLERFRYLLQRAGPHSLAILNEPFTSATQEDALRLSRALLQRLIDKKTPLVWVAFLDELARLPGVVSLAAQVDEADPTIRTYKILPGRPSGRAYVQALVRKYGLTSENIAEELSR